jgi:predicted metal-dependent hydrolase
MLFLQGELKEQQAYVQILLPLALEHAAQQQQLEEKQQEVEEQKQQLQEQKQQLDYLQLMLLLAQQGQNGTPQVRL